MLGGVEAAQVSPLYLKSRLLFALLALDCLLCYCVASEISSVGSTGTEISTRVETEEMRDIPVMPASLCVALYSQHTPRTQRPSSKYLNQCVHGCIRTVSAGLFIRKGGTDV